MTEPIPTEQLEQLIVLADRARADLAIVRHAPSLLAMNGITAGGGDLVARLREDARGRLDSTEAAIRAWAEEVCGVKS